MLFDLTGRRRGVVRVVYAVLAVLLAGGLLVGVGTATGVNPFTEGGGGGGSLEDQAQGRIDRAQAAVDRDRRNPARLASLIRARVDAANATADPNTGAYSGAGRAELRRADQLWQRYLALDPDEPEERVAQRMVIAYSDVGLQQPKKAADAQEIVVTNALRRARESGQAAPFSPSLVLVQLLYQAGEGQRAALAGRSAVALAPKQQRTAIRAQIDSLKTQSAAAAGAVAGGAASGGAAAPAG